jgi:methyl-accepting chemotaxis protein
MKNRVLNKITGNSSNLLKKEGAKTLKEMNKENNSEHSSIKSVLSDLTSTKSILSKMVLMFLLLIIIPVSIIGFIATNTASKSLRESTEASVSGTTLQTSNYFDAFLAKAKDDSNQLVANSIIQDYSAICTSTSGDDFDTQKVKAKKDATSVLTSINSSSQDINTKMLFNTGDTIGDINAPSDMDKVWETEWYKKVLAEDGKPIWVNYGEAMDGIINKSYALSLVSLFKDSNSGEISGLIFVDVNYKKITDVLGNINLGKKDASYLITQEGKVLSGKGQSEEKALAQRQFVKDVLERSKTKTADSFHTMDDKKDYLVSYNKSQETGIIVVMTIPNEEILAGANKIMWTTIWTGIIFVLIAGVIGFIFSLGMTLALKKIMGVMAKAENGDLTVNLKMRRKDEFGRLVISFNDMLDNIKELVKDNKIAAEEVVASSDKMTRISSQSSHISNEIAHAIMEVASGSANQASEVEVGVKNVSQLANKISLAVEKTHAMEVDSESMMELSKYGLTTIESLNIKTALTNEITTSVVNEISQLNQYVKNINVITQVLRSIADRTNLLALNAAIEAARAGDAGKGFAVVANEIRKLAEQSNNHTREIQKHIEDVFRQAQVSTQLVGKAETSIKEQSEMVAQTAKAFSRINATTGALAENINKVGNIITDMDSNKEMVMSSMENISAVSEQTSASAQEVSASTQQQLASIEQLDDMSKKLSELAANLIRQMEKFTV